MDRVPSYRLNEGEFETGKVHAVWSVLFDSASWHLTIEGHVGTLGTPSPSLCGIMNVRYQLIR